MVFLSSVALWRPQLLDGSYSYQWIFGLFLPQYVLKDMLAICAYAI